MSSHEYIVSGWKMGVKSKLGCGESKELETEAAIFRNFRKNSEAN